MITDKEHLIIIVSADKYLKDWGKEKHLNWFDMSHLLSYLLPYSKEEILEQHFKNCEEGSYKNVLV